MIELKDECEYCGRKEEDHRVNGAGKYCCMPFDYNLSYSTFKSITQALAEKNALQNLELLIKAKEVLEDMNQNSVDHFDAHELNLLMSKLSEAIKQSTE